MQCPNCNRRAGFRVKDTRPGKKDNAIRRARVCLECGHSFNTKEITAAAFSELKSSADLAAKAAKLFKSAIDNMNMKNKQENPNEK